MPMSSDVIVSRSPRLGDRIRTATPTSVAIPGTPAGTYLYVVLHSSSAVEAARPLIASRRWVVVERSAGSDPAPKI